MTFSVIIPTYNRAHCILDSINSVLDQTCPDFELIVVDDGSTDNTEEAVQGGISDERFHFFKKENGERGAARNFGIKKAKGNYVTFLDSDDLFYKDHLAKAVAFIEERSSNFFFQLFEIKEASGKIIQKGAKISQNILRQLVEEGNFLACMGVFVKRELLQANLFEEDRNLAGSEDYELWLRLACLHGIECNPVITSALMSHDDRSVLNFNAERLIVRITLMLEYIFKNDSENNLENYRAQLTAEAYSYIALHLVLGNSHKGVALSYFKRAIMLSPRFLLKRRSLAIVKHLLF